jgi:hypothetical protein
VSPNKDGFVLFRKAIRGDLSGYDRSRRFPLDPHNDGKGGPRLPVNWFLGHSFFLAAKPSFQLAGRSFGDNDGGTFDWIRRGDYNRLFFASRLWGRSPHWVKVKPKARAVTREAEEDWGR